MKEKQLELLKKVANGEITPEKAQCELRDLLKTTGIFSIDDVKESYNIGRVHEQNNVICTETDIENIWLKVGGWIKNIKWE